MKWDMIVVGGGSAGCVVAGRLSEDPARNVLLLEAGQQPEDHILSGMRPLTQEADWGLVDDAGEPLARGRCLGGSAAVNFGMWSRGEAADYDWGHEDWTYEALSGAVSRLEQAMPIDTSWPDDPASKRFFDLCAEAGLKPNVALGLPGQRGYGPMPRNIVGRKRVTSAATHLVRRPNLTVRLGANVERVVPQGVVSDGELVEGRNVVLCAGSYGSPRLLMRSGIGGGLPIGEGLSEHPGTFSVLVEPIAPPDEVYSPLAIVDSAHIMLFSAASFHMPDASALMIFLMDPESKGRVTLDTIERRLLRDGEDLNRLWELFLWGKRLAGDLEVRMGPTSPEDLDAGVQGYNHPACTCAFGQVVDERLRVIGEESVFVCDASVLPRIPMAGTNQPTMLVAERFSELYQSGV